MLNGRFSTRGIARFVGLGKEALHLSHSLYHKPPS